LSPIFSWKTSRKKPLDSFPLKPLRWKRFVDDTNVLWPHGKDELEKFFQHLNDISKDIKFTMELEENGTIPFLDVLIKRKEDDSLGHKVYRKKTHTENYLHASSHHHPAQKLGVLNTLAMRALRISDDDNLVQEKDHLSRVFKSIGYKDKDIKKMINKSLDRESNGPKPPNNQPPRYYNLPSLYPRNN
jgi:hypothetical protein